ncbi:MAG: hypothetical protein JRI39_03900 [Deltaproteobacteria bacterium]|nr:hypothetical protein [Deltaproteobacteria bacterium]MBW2082237.1 hypothetical protein [Deltaproteobacteria bacterium]HDM09998.1 hypothetical protein [Desulfobacteraceae bacterium]
MNSNDERANFPIHSCPGKIEIPTEEEQKALSELRKIKAMVREKKALLNGLKSSGRREEKHRITATEAELKELKEEWIKWERQKQDAARKRMIILGHEKPDESKKR